ncbi:MAG: cupin domain-containing protein [Bacteroidales bacterium]|nr:cupin domain-containing protein [Bacteroidales bacterium]
MKIDIEKVNAGFLKSKNIGNWPVWEKEISDFQWEYAETEECYILEGEADIITDVATITISANDFVTFHKGLTCRWVIRKPIRKHYNFIE